MNLLTRQQHPNVNSTAIRQAELMSVVGEDDEFSA
jgi:hypothetical protein